jgi:RHS repeat-associated protein
MSYRGNIFPLFLDNVYYENDYWHENFSYDNERQLKTSAFQFRNTSIIRDTFEYATNGNLIYKSGAGDLYYNDSKPYQIETITPSETLTEQEILDKFYNQTVVHTPFHRVGSVSQNNAVNANISDRADFTYNSTYERVKMSITIGTQTIRTKYYADDYEEIIDGNGVTTTVCYIRTPEGIQAAYKHSAGYLSGDIYYFSTDHTGSITSAISASGEVLERYLYDAWGNRRVITNGINLNESFDVYYSFNPEDAVFPLFDRGYIGEEHIDMFGLINLNARLYDPVLGRFLSPDPYVQDPYNLQNFNRYAYGLNNPLMYIDPDGEKIKWWGWLLIGLGIDAISGGAASAAITAAGVMSYTTIQTVSTMASTVLSTVDFTVSLVKELFTSDQTAFDNWVEIEIAQFGFIATMFSYDKSANGFEWVMQVINNLAYGEFLQDQVGKVYAHALNIGGKIEASGFYGGRLINRTSDNTIGGGISFGHYVFGDNIALHPYDIKHRVDLFAHEYGHTYQSRISGPLYLYKYGLASAVYGGSTEPDANRRGFGNLGLTPISHRYSDFTPNRYKWYELFGVPILWSFMLLWNN